MAVKIHQFELGIYPRKIWVAISATKVELENMFRKVSDIDEEDTLACVESVQTKEYPYNRGILMWFPIKHQ